MRVKICGLKNLNDAQLAVSLGATELGFIFCQSARRISSEEAKSISQNLPSETKTIGVFQDQPLELIRETVSSVGLKGVQLHGKESPDYVRRLRSMNPELLIFKMIGVDLKKFTLDPKSYSCSDALIFESLQKNFSVDSLESDVPFYLAGGITSLNVSSLVKRYRPSGIDLSSGIESSPGNKDSELMKTFFQTIKACL